MSKSKHLYRAKDILTGQWVYGNYINKVNGSVPLIVTNAWMQDNGDIDFDYHFVDKYTLEIVGKSQPNYDEGIPYCPDCNYTFSSFERPNFCPKCGLPLDWR